MWQEEKKIMYLCRKVKGKFSDSFSMCTHCRHCEECRKFDEECKKKKIPS